MKLIETPEQELMFELGRLRVENLSLAYQLKLALKRIEELESPDEEEK